MRHAPPPSASFAKVTPMPTLLLDRTLPRALDRLVEDFSAEAWRGGRLDAWLFEDEAARRGAERILAARGVEARIRSAYKPLLHAFLEEIDTAGLAAVTVATPAHEAGTEQRFRLEAYPLAGLLGAVPLAFTAGGGPLDYALTLERAGGSRETRTVFAPNRLRADSFGRSALSPCGWVRAWRPGAAAPARDEPFEAEFEAAFDAVMAALSGHAWPSAPPFVDTLEIAISLPGIERRIGWMDECVSTAEALHEELYFSILEFFQHQAGRDSGDRTLQPGQIIPEVVASDGPARVRVETRPHTPITEIASAPVALDDADRPLLPSEIAAVLAELPGERFEHRSVQGRPIPGLHRPGTGPGLVITGGQHANETSGVVGALRGARRLLAERPDLNLALVPQDNPDGYALHHRLRVANPRHMLHAARYTALGDDLEARAAEPFHEKAARLDAVRRTGARLHLNLHGYPSHEWTRPLNGYLPRGFELWSIPKGFFLIMRHHPGLAGPAEAFIDALAARLATAPDLAAYNAAQLKVWHAHAGAVPFPVRHGIPCMVTERDGQPTPFQLITEYPDETVYGDDFRLAHTTQMRTVLAAAELLAAGVLGR